MVYIDSLTFLTFGNILNTASKKVFQLFPASCTTETALRGGLKIENRE